MVASANHKHLFSLVLTQKTSSLLVVTSTRVYSLLFLLSNEEHDSSVTSRVRQLNVQRGVQTAPRLRPREERVPRMVWVRHDSNCQQLHVFGRVGVTFELTTFSSSVHCPGARPGVRPGIRHGGHPSVDAGAIGVASVFGGLVVALTPAFFFVLGQIL